MWFLLELSFVSYSNCPSPGMCTISPRGFCSAGTLHRLWVFFILCWYLWVAAQSEQQHSITSEGEAALTLWASSVEVGEPSVYFGAFWRNLYSLALPFFFLEAASSNPHLSAVSWPPAFQGDLGQSCSTSLCLSFLCPQTGPTSSAFTCLSWPGIQSVLHRSLKLVSAREIYTPASSILRLKSDSLVVIISLRLPCFQNPC